MRKHEEKTCERCACSFECKAGNISDCQCQTVSITPEQRAWISTEFQDCLCVQCLKELQRQYMNNRMSS